MKYIQKGEEPKQFLNWKNQEKETLDKFLAYRAKGETIWEHFPSSPPVSEEEQIIFCSKKELKEQLLQEQGFICCYCNQRIKNDHHTIIEHLKDKSNHPELTLEYSNLLASCNGGQKDPKPKELHCDAEKNNQELLISPLNPDCENHFYFSINGKIRANTQLGEQAIQVLNLGISKLDRLRKSAIDSYIFDENFEVINNEKAKLFLEKIYQRNNENEFIEFCSAIKSVLEREILNQKV